ncbi:hypothetical protein P2424_07885 [Streptomyces sp. WMMB303]|nr:hypothetical protein [Streptomyces sp. WMMB303]MDF4250288.1 hypothetical protein [Streptomyces sp. WMMB303]
MTQHATTRATVPAPAGRRPRSAPGWWRDAVIYQVYVRSFADGDGDGMVICPASGSDGSGLPAQHPGRGGAHAGAPGELLLCSAPEESRDAMEAGGPADQLRIPANSCTWWAA